MQPASRAGLLLFLIGFTSVAAQVVLMRELMVVFLGNEISLGAMLACWLLWTAFGSTMAGRQEWSPHEMAAVFGLAAAGLPAALLIARESKGLFQSAAGELLGFGPMLITSFAALAVLCAASGWLFAAASHLFGADAARSTGSAYLWEAAGAASGGLAASLVLVRFTNPFTAAAAIACLDVLAACSLLAWHGRVRIAAGVLLVPMLACGAWYAERVTLAHLWRGFLLVDTRNTAYGNLAVVEAEGGRSLAENGLLIATFPDPSTAEEAVHFALLEHPAPRTVLLIGGGVNGSLAEALKHPGLERLVYTELDPAIPELARVVFPAAIPRDARVAIRSLDGRLYVKRAAERFDVIIVGLPGPQTAQLNRFYTAEFFREAAQRLNPGGILSLGFAASENYISPELSQLLRSIGMTLRTAFPQVVAIPGETVHLLASQSPLPADADVLVRRLRERNIETSYVSPHFLPYRITPERVKELAAHVAPAGDTPVNRDMTPIAYYFNTTLWSSRFSRRQSGLLEMSGRVRFGALLSGFIGVTALLAFRLRRAPAGLCTGTMGFTMIGLEVVLLLGFQAMHGYVYQQIAVLIAGFMSGMALGSWLALRFEAPGRWLAILQAGAVLAPLVVCALLRFGPLAIGLAAVGSGILGGCQFPVASAVYFEGRRTNRGALYAIDLAGSSVGAMLFSAYLIPVFGFLKTAALMSAVNVAPALAAARGRQKPAR
jgi:spermidine synthase